MNQDLQDGEFVAKIGQRDILLLMQRESVMGKVNSKNTSFILIF
jgi:hypothetical protein